MTEKIKFPPKLKTSPLYAAFPSLKALNDAAQIAPYHGLIGNIVPAFYNALSTPNLSSHTRLLAWNHMQLAAVESHNIAGLVRSLFDLESLPNLSHDDHALLQGHVLRKFARDYAESAKAFAKNGKSTWRNALAALIALQSLRRLDPQCSATQLCMDEIRNNGLIVFESKSDIEKQLNALPPTQKKQRLRLLINLSVALLIDWGDTGSALDWLDNVIAQSDPSIPNQRIVDICTAIARASLDQIPILSRTIPILEKYHAHRDIADIAILFLLLSPDIANPPPALLMTFARERALTANDDKTAEIFCCLSALAMKRLTAREQKIIWDQNVWICNRAAQNHSVFQTLYQALQRLNHDENTLLVLGRVPYKTPGADAVECKLQIVRVLNRLGRMDDALSILSNLIHATTDNDNASLRHIASELTHTSALCNGSHQSQIASCHLALQKKRYHLTPNNLFDTENNNVACVNQPPVHKIDRANTGEDGMRKKIQQDRDEHNHDRKIQQQMLESLDDAIRIYDGDHAQLLPLLEKKLNLLNLLGNDDEKLSCLTRLLLISQNNGVARSELVLINPNRLSPLHRIDYFMLTVQSADTKQSKRDAQCALALEYVNAGHLDKAAKIYDEILADNPNDTDVKYKLLNLLEISQDWRGAQSILTDIIATAQNTDTCIHALDKLANIQDAYANQPENALLLLFNIIDIAPNKLQHYHPQLLSCAERANRLPALIEKYEEISKFAKSYEERRLSVFLLANVCTLHYGNTDIAALHLNAFLENEGASDPDFLIPLSDFYEKTNRLKSLVKVNTLLLQITQDPRERAERAIAVARIQNEAFQNTHKAAQFARLAAQTGINHAKIWTEIARYLFDDNALKDAADALDQAALYESDKNLKTAILYCQTILYAQALLDNTCGNAFEKISVEPAFAIDHLTQIAQNLIAWTAETKNKSLFLSLCHTLVKHCPSSECHALQIQQALSLVQTFGDKKNAVALVRNIDANAHGKSTEQYLLMAQIFSDADQFDDSNRIIDRALSNYALSVQENFQLQKLKKQNNNALLEQNKNAISHFNRSASTKRHTHPGLRPAQPPDATFNPYAASPQALFNTIEILYNDGKWDNAIREIPKLMTQIESLNTLDAIKLHYYYGELLHAAQNDDLAIECLDNALRLDRNFRPAVNLKLTILIENQRWPEAFPLFDLLLSLTNDPEEQGAIHKRIAEIHHFYLHHTDLAIQEYEDALSLGGDVDDVPQRLLRLYIDAHDWNKAALTAQVLADAQSESPEMHAAYLRIYADIHATHLGDLEEAALSLIDALTIAPYNQETLASLSQIFIKQNDWTSLSHLFDQFIHALSLSPNKATAQLKTLVDIAQPFENAANDVARAKKACPTLLQNKKSTQTPTTADNDVLDIYNNDTQPPVKKQQKYPAFRYPLDNPKKTLPTPKNNQPNSQKTNNVVTSPPANLSFPTDDADKLFDINDNRNDIDWLLLADLSSEDNAITDTNTKEPEIKTDISKN